MHRRPLLEMLARYRQAHPAEADMVDRIRSLVEGYADCFERSCRPGHITGAAWILSPDRRRSLLTHHRQLGRWLQLGGHADGEPHIHEVALREAREESGMTGFDFLTTDGPLVSRKGVRIIFPLEGSEARSPAKNSPDPFSLVPLDVDVHLIPARSDTEGRLVEDAHEHHDIRFLLVAHPGQAIRPSDESYDVGWFTPDEVRQLTDEQSVLRMLDKALTLLG
jgi:8-oxo-dGTP pyrophosphatase MutT (NUDIX family)